MKLLNRQIGQRQEAVAEQYLQQQGLATIQRNYQCRQGEIDLVMRDGETLVFVEVRFRKNADHGTAAETVDHRKQQKLLLAARHFLGQHTQYQQLYCRFDVLGIDNINPAQFTWLQNAFTE